MTVKPTLERITSLDMKLREQIQSGNFWADKIKKLPNDERLKLAVEHLPLLGAFREGCIALRAIIREKLRAGESYERDLEQLYWLAALGSFSKPYSELLMTPGFNVLMSIPLDTIKSFNISWEYLGYQNLSLLKKTDVKWMTNIWGEPKRHSSLIQDYAHVWDEYEVELSKMQKSCFL